MTLLLKSWPTLGGSIRQAKFVFPQLSQASTGVSTTTWHKKAQCQKPKLSSTRPIHSSIMPQLQIHVVPCLTGTSNNYAYLLHDSSSGATAVVDPSEAAPIIAQLSELGLKLTHIMNTHHHWDHTGGNEELKKKFGATVVGSKIDKDRIPFIDVAVGEGDTWQLGSHTFDIFDIPGHTRGHISFYCPASKAVFTGDTLFSLGCGRLFEGTPHQMWSSLSKLAALPGDTLVYPGHEYTQANAKFALSVEPGNVDLQKRSAEVVGLRKQGVPTIPSTINDELAANPFLRPHSQEIRKHLNLKADAADVESFAAIRRAKDAF